LKEEIARVRIDPETGQFSIFVYLRKVFDLNAKGVPSTVASWGDHA